MPEIKQALHKQLYLVRFFAAIYRIQLSFVQNHLKAILSFGDCYVSIVDGE